MRNIPPLIVALVDGLPAKMDEQYLTRFMNALEASLRLCYDIIPNKPRVRVSALPCGSPGHRCDPGNGCAPSPPVLYRETRRVQKGAPER